MTDKLKEQVLSLKEEMIGLRRDFHRYPELSMQERRTARRVADYLIDLGLTVTTDLGGTGVVGLLGANESGKTLLVRADMDALPIQEETALPFKSENSGVMHACGHDGHMAILLSTAKLLSLMGGNLGGRVKFVFQPGEEIFKGAAAMIKDGVMENPDVDAALGFHLINQIPLGVIGLRKGALMASADAFRIRIMGKGGHAGMPDQGVDAILMSAHTITSLQSLISKEVSPFTPLVVHVGKIKGGDAYNIIARHVELEGTVRTLDEALQKSMPERMERILKGIVSALRGSYEIDYEFGCPTVINEDAMTDLVRNAAAQVVGQKGVTEVQQIMGSEDFAFFLKEVPGCYFFVGAGNKEKGLDKPHHNAGFDFDEEALLSGAETLTRSVLAYFGSSYV